MPNRKKGKMNDYLIHYGVPGMKWGVRKAPERSPRPFFRRKKKVSNQYRFLRRRPSRSKEVTTKSKSLSNKNIKKMSDSEISNQINRLEQERKLQTLRSQTQTTQQRGKSIIAEILSNSARNTLQNVITQQATKRINGAIDKRFGDPTKDKYDQLLKQASAREKNANARAQQLENFEKERKIREREEDRKFRAVAARAKHAKRA